MTREEASMSEAPNGRLEKALATDQWNVSTLHDHITQLLGEMDRRMEQRFEAQEKATSLAFAAQEKATTTALAAADMATHAAMAAAEKAVLKAEALATQRAEQAETLASERAKQQNEWRQTVSDITGTMLSKAEYEVAHGNLIERMGYENSLQAKNEGARMGTSQTITWVIAGCIATIGVVFGVLELLLH